MTKSDRRERGRAVLLSRAFAEHGIYIDASWFGRAAARGHLGALAFCLWDWNWHEHRATIWQSDTVITVLVGTNLVNVYEEDEWYRFEEPNTIEAR